MDKINHTTTRPTVKPVQAVSSIIIQHALTELFGPQLVKDFDAGEVERVAKVMDRLSMERTERGFMAALEMVRRVEMGFKQRS